MLTGDRIGLIRGTGWSHVVPYIVQPRSDR